jgi:hypothetical protein
MYNIAIFGLAIVWATFYKSTFYLFAEINSFKTRYFITNLRFQKCFGLSNLAFMAIFGLATVWATFPKHWATFSDHLVTLNLI